MLNEDNEMRPGKFKYKNEPTVVDGITFHSKKEAGRYRELKILADIGQIINFECQPAYELRVNGVLVCKYKADFRYQDRDWPDVTCVEDVKGYKTREYELKKKLMLAIHGIRILET